MLFHVTTQSIAIVVNQREMSGFFREEKLIEIKIYFLILA